MGLLNEQKKSVEFSILVWYIPQHRVRALKSLFFLITHTDSGHCGTRVLLYLTAVIGAVDNDVLIAYLEQWVCMWHMHGT